jgi:hypothetical protein
MPLNDFKGLRLSRRNALKAGFGGVVAAQLALIEQSAFTPLRAAAATGTRSPHAFPIIQFDIGNFVAAPVTLNDGAGNITAQFGPVFTYIVPATLSRAPTPTDQRVLSCTSRTTSRTCSSSMPRPTRTPATPTARTPRSGSCICSAPTRRARPTACRRRQRH